MFIWMSISNKEENEMSKVVLLSAIAQWVRPSSNPVSLSLLSGNRGHMMGVSSQGPICLSCLGHTRELSICRNNTDINHQFVISYTTEINITL